MELDFDFDVRYVELEPMELEDKDFPRLSELFLMILVAVLLQSGKNREQDVINWLIENTSCAQIYHRIVSSIHNSPFPNVHGELKRLTWE